MRKLKAKGQVLDYCQGLKEDEKSFVEAYRGDDVQAVLAIGHWKGYKAIRLASREYLANPQIRAALKTKRKNHLPLYKLITHIPENFLKNNSFQLVRQPLLWAT